MARYIDADKAINELADMHCKSDEDGYVWIIRSDAWARIDAIPSADVRENVRGEWEQVVSGCAILMRCNQCKNAISENDFFEICRKVNHGSKLLDFCPNCGADMRANHAD